MKTGLRKIISIIENPWYLHGLETKVAISLTGHFRQTFEKPALIEYLQKSRFKHIYIHTWNRLESNTSLWRPKDDESKIAAPFPETKAQAMLNPIILSVEDQAAVSLSGINNPGLMWGNTNCSYVGYKYLWYSLYTNLNNIITYSTDNDFKYEYLIRMRPDMYRWKFQTDLLNKIIVQILKNGGNIILGHNLGNRAGDNIFGGDFENYKKLVFTMYENFDQIYKETSDKTHPEHMVATALNSLQIPFISYI